MDLEQLKCLLDILMAAAAVDGHTDRQETEVIRALLDEISVDAEMRTELESHKWSFELGEFDLEASIKGLGRLTSEDRRAVIHLLERIEEADGVIDFEEAEFIRRVATALGASPEEVDTLTVEILTSGPPPMPKF